MPSLIDLRRRDPRGQEHAADHEGDEDGRRVEAAPRAGADHGRAAVRAADAARARQRRGARRSVDPSAARRAASPAPTAGRCVIVVTGDKGLCGSFNTNVIKAAGALRRRERRQPVRARPGRPQGPRLLRPPRLRRAVRAGRHLPEAAVTRTRRRSRRAGDRGVHRAAQVDRVYARLQRVQVGDVAARRRRAAAADSRARTSSGAGAPAGRRRRSTTCTSRRRRRSSTSCCRATSRCRCTARCSSRTPRSSRRR